MSGNDDDSEKSFDPTPQKLLKARKKGEVAKSNDLTMVAGFSGLVLALLIAGPIAVRQLGNLLMVLLDQPDRISALLVSGPSSALVGGVLATGFTPVVTVFAIPAAAVLLCLFAQRAMVFAPDKLKPRMSRISIVSNAKNKFGRAGLFEFAKSFTKLLIYCICLALFLHGNLATILTASAMPVLASVPLMVSLLFRFMFIVVAVALAIGSIDFAWQYAEHIRKNRMSRKEIQDETKDSEGDPHIKQQRRQKAQDIATNQMMADVPNADVVIVNPTHYAVALTWSRAPALRRCALPRVLTRLRRPFARPHPRPGFRCILTRQQRGRCMLPWISASRFQKSITVRSQPLFALPRRCAKGQRDKLDDTQYPFGPVVSHRCHFRPRIPKPAPDPGRRAPHSEPTCQTGQTAAAGPGRKHPERQLCDHRN